MTTPAGGATRGGTLFGDGVPTITVRPRTSVPARSVSKATPGVPVVTVTFATVDPAAIVTPAAIMATAGLLVSTVTGVMAAAGFASSLSVTVRCPLPAARSSPAEGGFCTLTSVGAACTLNVCCDASGLTETIEPAVPSDDDASTVVLPTATPVIGTTCAVSPAAIVTVVGTLSRAGSTALTSTTRSCGSARVRTSRTGVVAPGATPVRRGSNRSPTTTATTTWSWPMPPPSRAVAVIVSAGVVAADGVVNGVVNGGVAAGGKACPFTVNVTVVMPSDALPRASSTIRVFSGTLAPLIGLVIEKVPVVNANLSGAISGLPEASARWLPATSVMSALSANRTSVPNGSGALGTKRTTLLPLTNANAPATGVAPAVTLNEAGVTVAVSTGSVNVTWTATATETSVEPSAGLTLTTRGGVVSGNAVVKLALKLAASALPARSETAVPTAAVTVVLSGNGLAGASVTTRSPSLKPMVAGTAPAGVVRLTLVAVTEARATGSENRTDTTTAGSTPIAPFAGLTSATVGATTSRTFTATDAAVPWLPAASRARASSVSAPPVGGGVAKVTLKVSLRLAAAGLTGRVSLVAAAPVALSVISVTPTLSVACTVTSRGARGSTAAPGAGLVIVTVGASVSRSVTLVAAGALSLPAWSRATTVRVMLPGAVPAGTDSVKLTSAGVVGGVTARASLLVTAPVAVYAI